MQVEGLQIRRAEPDDCSALYEMFKSPKVFESTLQLPYPSREQWRQRLTEPSEDVDSEHDYVVQARGAFEETVLGIQNLGRYGVPVEIRVVIHKQTYGRLP